MVKVEFLGPIEKESMELEVQNMRQLQQHLQKDSEIAQWLDRCSVALNDTLITSLDLELKSGDRVAILPPVCGG
ncbi:MAG: MoaD/ThiS family protein [Campylobacterota bacterium]